MVVYLNIRRGDADRIICVDCESLIRDFPGSGERDGKEPLQICLEINEYFQDECNRHKEDLSNLMSKGVIHSPELWEDCMLLPMLSRICDEYGI